MRRFHNLIFGALGLAAAAEIQAGAPGSWPPEPGDLILGVQATGGTGSNTNLFYNLGPGSGFRDNPSQSNLGDLSDQLETAFGNDWFTRTDLYFGVIANRSPFDPATVPAANGDTARTFYVSKAPVNNVAGTAVPFSPLVSSQLGTAGQTLAGQVSMLQGLTATAGVATLLSSDSVRWANSWTTWNPFLNGGQSIAYKQFGGGIQNSFGKGGAVNVDVFRILGTTGTGTYVTTVSIDSGGVVNAANAGGAATYVAVTPTATNGSILGATGVSYLQGSTARLTAVPSAGFGFIGWSQDASGSTNPLNLVMDSNKSVTASFAALPTVTSPTATAITGDAATLGGDVTGDGGQTLSNRGVVFSELALNPNPLIGSANTTDLMASAPHGTGTFTVDATGLTPATTYVFKAYAISPAGTTYTAASRFTTDTTVTFVGGIGTVTDRQVFAGDNQVFRFNLADARTVNFTSTGATGFNWELRNANNAVVASGNGNVAVAQLLLAGNYSLGLTNATATNATVSLNLNAATAAVSRPDVQVGPNALATVGANRYTPVIQTSILTSRTALPVTGFARVGNDGTLPTALRVFGSRGTLFFRATYFGRLGANPNANITGQINAGTYTTPVLTNASPLVTIRAAITPTRSRLVTTRRVGARWVTTTRRMTFNAAIRATSVSGPVRNDSATIRVNTL